jgi:uncharacterized protein (DUF2062 family)/trans-aconitate methyltransferase
MRLLHRLRTEADSPARQAAAVGVGTYIGCTPFYGFHLILAVAFASLLRLNRLKVYLAANISNPLFAPFLVAAELQVGSWITRASWYAPASLDDVHAWGIAHDLLIGSAAVGAGLGVVTAALTYGAVARRAMSPFESLLLSEAADRYLITGCASWELAQGKLRRDPVYISILKRGGLPPQGTLVDAGCGRGLMLSLLATAAAHRHDDWPRDWPTPPGALRLVGIESRERMVDKARHALGAAATVVHGDLREVPLPSCDALVLFDVLHLLAGADQDVLLARIHHALAPGGLLVMREADAAGGWRFHAVQTVNTLCRVLQGQWQRTPHFCTAAEWQHRLAATGFDVEMDAMHAGTPFANIVFYARKPVH